MMFRPEGCQPPITIIFRGKGKRISAVEKASWDPRVNVMFQEKAWADREFCKKWASQIASPWLEEQHPEQDTLMFLDNLDGQVHESFKDILKEANCTRFLLPPETTDHTQPVDGGLGKNVKGEISYEHEVWLQDKDNLEKWESGKISEMEKRILITHWAAAAWERVFTSQHPRKYFERTGCLLTIDGS